MRLAQAGIAPADAGGEMIPGVELGRVAMNRGGASARELAADAAGAGQEFGTMFGVMLPPDPVGGVPLSAWKVGGLIDAVPVWGIVLFEFRQAPGGLHLGEQGEMSGGVGRVG